MNHQDFQPGAQSLHREPRPGGTGDGSAPRHEASGATAIRLLNRALAIARSVLPRCERQYLAALRSHTPAAAAAALEHAHDARIHVDRIAERIDALGGETAEADPAPDAAVTRSRAEPVGAPTLAAAIRGAVAAERDAIAGYTEIAAFFRPSDPATLALIEDIASDAEQRARELAGLLDEVPNF